MRETERKLVHLDTDLGGDPDDACALAMLLGWRDAELVGITTTIDAGGERAGCVAHCLELAGREEIPLAAGAAASLTTLHLARSAVGDDRYWPNGIKRLPSSPGAALDLLARSIEQGATVIAIGPLTNLALLGASRPALLERATVVAMGGWIAPPARGLPDWGPEMDFNVQWDTRATEVVAASADLTLVPLSLTLRAHLRERDLTRLRASGALGALLAQQSQAGCSGGAIAELARAHAGLPGDLVNFHHDPLACAVALAWSGAAVETMALRPVVEGSTLRFEPDGDGRSTRVAIDFDPQSFRETWLTAVEIAAAPR